MNSTCEEGDIRYDPDRLEELVIQACVDGIWGYMCGYIDIFSKEDIAVACNQMGYKSGQFDHEAGNETTSVRTWTRSCMGLRWH